ncbi:MAG: GNAT family N-acetyltransferase, partial [Candidatus Bipolaricaulaceae bacterium]
ENGRKRMVGVGRLVADPDRINAEYAVFVADPWQNKGLGGILTDYALEIARGWGIRQVTAETTPDNVRMIRILEKHSFTLKYHTEESVVLAAKPLDLR